MDSDIKMKIEGEYELNWLDKLEKKLGRFAIPNLTVYLLAGYVIGFAIYYLAPGFLGWLTLEPAYIKRTGLEDYFLGIDSTDGKFDFLAVSCVIVLFSWLSP